MTLKEIKRAIERIADKQPNINTVIKSGDIYELNTLGDVEYSAFCLTQQQHTETNGFRTYNFYLFVVDRLLSDGKNKISAQSAAIECLSNIIKALSDRYEDELEVGEDIVYQAFTQRFASETAGAYATIKITVPVTNCYENYDVPA